MKRFSSNWLRLMAWLLLSMSVVVAVLILLIGYRTVIADDFINAKSYNYIEFEGASGFSALAVICIGALLWFLLNKQAHKADKSQTDY